MGDSLGGHLLHNIRGREVWEVCIRAAQGKKVQSRRGTYMGKGAVQEVKRGGGGGEARPKQRLSGSKQ